MITLRVVVDNYIKQMEKLNDQRLKSAYKELETCVRESQLFNELRQNLLMTEPHSQEEDVISKNK